MSELRRILYASEPHKEHDAIMHLRSRDAVHCHKYSVDQKNDMRGHHNLNYYGPPPPLIRAIGTDGTEVNNRITNDVNTIERQRVLQRTMIQDCVHVVRRREYWQNVRATVTVAGSINPDTAIYLKDFVCEEY